MRIYFIEKVNNTNYTKEDILNIIKSSYMFYNETNKLYVSQEWDVEDNTVNVYHRFSNKLNLLFACIVSSFNSYITAEELYTTSFFDKINNICTSLIPNFSGFVFSETYIHNRDSGELVKVLDRPHKNTTNVLQSIFDRLVNMDWTNFLFNDNYIIVTEHRNDFNSLIDSGIINMTNIDKMNVVVV